MNILKSLFGNYSKREVKRVQHICDSVLALEDKYKEMSNQDLINQTSVLKDRLKNGETVDDLLPDAFAVCREASDRVLGMKHFPVQIIGGIILHQGRISEMQTGEGKTLVATLPAYLNALSGKGVHVVTANDYLAQRDSDLMGKVYRFLGLTAGAVLHNVDNEMRKKAYESDITYGTNNEMGFDYLRDNMVTYKEQRVQRGHHFAIVDEVDSILIDEARTPLIISGPGEKSTELYTIADKFAKTLKLIKVAEVDSKEEQDDLYEGSDYIVDEKSKTATLTKSGVKKAEEFFHLENLTDAENITIQHHINQAIKANGIMQNEIDYVVKNGQVVIVDEFTGRLMDGRRYNEGLHQAIEAKEGVKIERESKTLATVTFQNYFRLYDKLSGMTGTGLTEEEEFREIYKLDVVAIPTNRPIKRIDATDAIFKTEKGKFMAIIEQIKECAKKGQPVLVGTISIDKSEILSMLLRKEGIKHNVLNAKYHEKEAEIISQAGKKGAITIATNMAGRGTDISLGGNADFMSRHEMKRMGFTESIVKDAVGYAETTDERIIEARDIYNQLLKKHKEEIKAEAEAVKEAGGLFVMGTERHESRRIDNQLRGRSGRQGDPGESRFYLSCEDDLVRLFNGDRMKNMMDKFNVEEDVPIDNKMLSNAIEGAQKKVEGRNFGSRKSVLQFDDVLNRQREVIYDQRNKVLDGEDIKDQIQKMIEQAIVNTVDQYIPDDIEKEEWNVEGLKDYYMGWMINEDDNIFNNVKNEDFTKDLLVKQLQEKAIKIYKEREENTGPELMRELERVVLLNNVDKKWMDHIDAMEELKRGIRLRAYGQRDPAVEYRVEGFDMFDQMVASIREETARIILTLKMEHINQAPKRVEPPKKIITNEEDILGGRSSYSPIKNYKVGRNDLCPCGSGKKYKKCCGFYLENSR